MSFAFCLGTLRADLAPAEEQLESTSHGVTLTDEKELLKAFHRYAQPISSRVEEIAFCGDLMDKIIVLLDNGRVIHSKNFGRTWEKLEGHMLGGRGQELPFIFAMQQSTLDHNIILLMDRDKAHVVTRNCGESYQAWALRLSRPSFHPSEASTLLGIDDARTLWLTKDLGANWRAVAANITDFSFAKYAENAFLAAADRVVASRRSGAPPARPRQDLVFSDDYFNTTTRILGDIEFFKLTKCCIYARETNRETAVTDAFGWFYFFYNVTIEGEDSRDFTDVNVLDTEDFFNTFGTVERDRKGRAAHDLLKSDFFGADFKVLLKDLVCDRELAECDFLPLRSLPGSLVVNRFDRSFLDAVNDLPAARRSKLNDLVSYDNLFDYRVTLLSFDFGESFRRIPAPRLDEQGQPLLCEGDCFLNLHLQSSARDFLLPKTSALAPGLILAAGTVSAYLQQRPSLEERHEGLFLSLDGGAEWRMVARGRYLFEILDNGNTLLAAPRGEKVREVLFSLDSGSTWRNMTFADEPTEVIALTVRERTHLKKALVYAKLSSAAQERYQLITLDFSNVNERLCAHNALSPSDSDYEEWTPAGASASGCVNGRVAAYIRKVPSRQCNNPDGFVMVVEKEYCACTDADYHCNFGFKRDHRGNCVEDPKFRHERDSRAENCKGSYPLPSNYKRNYETFCVGGVEHSDGLAVCQGKSSAASRLAKSLFKLLVGAACAYVLFKAAQRFDFLFRLGELWAVTRSLSRSYAQKAKDYKEMKKIKDGNAYSGKPRLGTDSLFDDDDDPNSSIEVQIGK